MKKFRYLLFIFGFMLCMIPNVKADTSYTTSVLNLLFDVAQPIMEVNVSNRPFKNLGDGHLIFSFVTYTTGSQILPLKGVFADNGSQSFTCNIGNFSGQTDESGNRYAGYSVDCPINMNSNGLVKIYFDFPSANVTQYVTTSYNATFVSNDTTDLSQLLSVVNQLYTDMGYGFARQYTQLSEIYGRIGYGFEISNNLNQQILDILKESDKTIDEIKESVDKVDDTLNSTDTNESQSQANSFFEGFESDDYGLSDIVTMPLELIKGLTSNTCVALSLTLPFVNKTFELPCMSSIYQEYFGSFFTLYQTVTFGFVAYWVIVKIFALVKGFKDPDDDKVEVMDL